MFSAMTRLSGNAGDNETVVHVAICGFRRKKKLEKEAVKNVLSALFPLIFSRTIMTPN